ncbi:unnamed protein product [Staurois parvus]|uniref:Uncharacterized protein n=1 Tax=Staurois parvus TaxID=386267 RepID=A0ABN9DHD4_9NEOB|nr:unnamed protein product [Staurois parvus]
MISAAYQCCLSVPPHQLLPSSATHQCAAGPPTIAQQCHPAVLPRSCTHQCPAVLPISSASQCHQSAPLVSPSVSVVHQCHLSVPISATYQ